MKAYIVTIELVDAKEPMWRRVILPFGGTFRRLHDTIQYVTNFKSGYGMDIHLYHFFVKEENLFVTNDEQALEQYRMAVKNKESVSRTLRSPSSIKMDKYLENYRQLHYVYDYGDEWEFIITLEEVVEDYYFGYPTLLDGEGDAPIEDLGGVEAFALFLTAWRDPDHPFHHDAVAYGKSQRFRPYNKEWTNSMLKHIAWKKTQWDKIHHKNYEIIWDKYRKPVE